MRFDLHCHTIYSRHWYWGVDALNTPREMIKAAVKKGLDGIAITDHDNIKGALQGLRDAKGFKHFNKGQEHKFSTSSTIKNNILIGIVLL